MAAKVEQKKAKKKSENKKRQEAPGADFVRDTCSEATRSVKLS